MGSMTIRKTPSPEAWKKPSVSQGSWNFLHLDNFKRDKANLPDTRGQKLAIRNKQDEMDQEYLKVQQGMKVMNYEDA